MQRHPPLIVKDLEEQNHFWTAIDNYVKPYINSKSDIESKITEILDYEITDIEPSELHLMKKKIADLYPDEKFEDIDLSYNVFLGLDHYQNIIKKIFKPVIPDFDR